MLETTIEQARFLHRTIKQVQTRLLSQHGPFTIDTDEYSVELTFTQLCTLMTIRDHNDMNLKEIAEITQVSPHLLHLWWKSWSNLARSPVNLEKQTAAKCACLYPRVD